MIQIVLLTYSMKQRPSSEADKFSQRTKQFSAFYGTRRCLLVGKPEGKKPLGRPRGRWEDNINMDVQEVGGGHGDWMELAQDRDKQFY
jgi:hypothetical protein